MLCGCQSLCNTKRTSSSRFYVESQEAGVIATLPISRVSVNVFAQPLFTERDIDCIELREGICGNILVFHTNENSTYDLYTASVMHDNKRVVLECSGEIIGMTTFSDAITDGSLIIYPEKSDEELMSLVSHLNTVVAKVKREKNR